MSATDTGGHALADPSDGEWADVLRNVEAAPDDELAELVASDDVAPWVRELAAAELDDR